MSETEETETKETGAEAEEDFDASAEFTVVDTAEDDEQGDKSLTEMEEAEGEESGEAEGEKNEEGVKTGDKQETANGEAGKEESNKEATKEKSKETEKKDGEQPMDTEDDAIVIIEDDTEDAESVSESVAEEEKDTAFVEAEMKDVTLHEKGYRFSGEYISDLGKVKREKTLAVFPVEVEDLALPSIKAHLQKATKSKWHLLTGAVTEEGNLRGVLEMTFLKSADLEDAQKELEAMSLNITRMKNQQHLDSWVSGLDSGWKAAIAPPKQSERMAVIYDLPKDVTEKQLEELFPDAFVGIPVNNDNKPKGFGLLEFPNREAALATLKKRRREINGKNVRLEDLMTTGVKLMQTNTMFSKVAGVVMLRWDIARNWNRLTKADRMDLIRKIYIEEFQLKLDGDVKKQRRQKKATLWVNELQKRLRQREGCTGTSTDHYLKLSVADLIRKVQEYEQKEKERDVPKKSGKEKEKEKGKEKNREKTKDKDEKKDRDEKKEKEKGNEKDKGRDKERGKNRGRDKEKRSPSRSRSRTSRSRERSRTQDRGDKRRRHDSPATNRRQNNRNRRDRGRDRGRQGSGRRSPVRERSREDRRSQLQNKPVSLLGLPPLSRSVAQTPNMVPRGGAGYADERVMGMGMAGMMGGMGQSGMVPGAMSQGAMGMSALGAGTMSAGTMAQPGMAVAGAGMGATAGGMGGGQSRTADAFNLLVSLSKMLNSDQNVQPQRQQQQQLQQQQLQQQQQQQQLRQLQPQPPRDYLHQAGFQGDRYQGGGYEGQGYR